MRFRRRPLLAAALAAPGIAAAQGSWPDRPIRLLVPFPPGGAIDTLSRMVAERLSAKLGQQVLAENRAGASANLATEALARSAPDGYTLATTVLGVWVINQFLFARLPFDADRDLAPISMMWDQTNVMVVAAEHNPARNVAQFMAWAQDRRGRISYGHGGAGTTPHLCAEWFNRRFDLQATAIPFRGGAPVVPALLRGDVDFAFDNLPTYAGMLPEGRIKALAVTAERRWPTLPDVPTLAEGGLTDFVVTSWSALSAPAGTPPAIIARINQAMREANAEEQTRQRFLLAGARSLWSTPDEVRERVRRERPMWQEMVRISGARAD